MMCLKYSCYVLFAYLFMNLASLGADTVDPYEKDYTYIQQLSISKYGRDAVVQECEKLISRYPSDPRNPKVMLYVSHLYSDCEIPKANVAPDRNMALKWSERAVQTSKRGSQEWIEAQFRIFNHVLSQNTLDYEKAHSILAEIESSTKDVVILCQVTSSKMDLAETIGDYKTAIEEYKKIVNGNDKMEDRVIAKEISRESSHLEELLSEQRGATARMIDYLRFGFKRMSNLQRDVLLKDLMTSLPHEGKLQEEGIRALEFIEKQLTDEQKESMPKIDVKFSDIAKIDSMKSHGTDGASSQKLSDRNTAKHQPNKDDLSTPTQALREKTQQQKSDGHLFAYVCAGLMFLLVMIIVAIKHNKKGL